MSKPDQGKSEAPPGRKLGRGVITLVLVLIVIIAGIGAYGARQQWWEMYLSYLGK